MSEVKEPELYTWSQVEEFARNAFYKGRELGGVMPSGQPFFERPTYNGYLREIEDDIEKYLGH